eukprot:g14018.t1
MRGSTTRNNKNAKPRNSANAKNPKNRRSSFSRSPKIQRKKSIKLESMEQRQKSNEEKVKYSKYGYEETVQIEKELAKRRYMLRRMKQNVRQEYRMLLEIEKIDLERELGKLGILNSEGGEGHVGLKEKIRKYEQKRSYIMKQITFIEKIVMDSSFSKSVETDVISDKDINMLTFRDDDSQNVDVTNRSVIKDEMEKRKNLEYHVPCGNTFVNIVKYKDVQMYRNLLKRKQDVEIIQEKVKKLALRRDILKEDLKNELEKKSPKRDTVKRLKTELKEVSNVINENHKRCRFIFPNAEEQHLLDLRHRINEAESVLRPSGAYCVCIIDKSSNKQQTLVLPVLPGTTVQELKDQICFETKNSIPSSVQILKCIDSKTHSQELIEMENWRSISFYNLTPDFSISEENGEAAMVAYNDIIENDINTNTTWLNNADIRENDQHYKNLSIILRALEHGGRVLRYFAMILLKMRNVSENTGGNRVDIYLDLFYDYRSLLTGRPVETLKQRISLMTEEEKKQFHNSLFKSFLAEPCLDRVDLTKFDIASVRLSFNHRDETDLIESITSVKELFQTLSLTYDREDGTEIDPETCFRMLEYSMIASQIEQFAANPIRRKQQVLVDRCLSKPLIGLNYEEAMKKLKRYIKHTVSEKTYLDRKFTRALTYEEQEQEVLNGNSLERELAEIMSEENLRKMHHNYRFDQICIYLTTTKNEINSKINICEKGIKELNDATFALGPATQQ